VLPVLPFFLPPLRWHGGVFDNTCSPPNIHSIRTGSPHRRIRLSVYGSSLYGKFYGQLINSTGPLTLRRASISPSTLTIMEISVRIATIDDAAEIARLSGELGYASTSEDVAARLNELLEQGAFVAVAVQHGPSLAGWIAADARLTLESGRKAEITGLVVDSRAKRSGVGARLVAAAERWAAAAGHSAIVVRSNAARLESHPFYMGQGYARTKTQHVYAKQLAAK
jgi:GNAT superfamily N-acetyltransferase